MSQQKSKKKMAERRTQRRHQSQIRLIVGISVTAVVVVGAIVLLTLLSNNRAPNDYSGLTQDIDRSGAFGIAIGEPSAPVTLVEYSDFSCSHCKELSETINTLIAQYVADGQLRVVYKPTTIVNPANSEPASRAAICAAEQGKGWQMIDHIWRLSGPASYDLASFVGIDAKVGLDTASFRECFDSPEAAQAVLDVNAETTGKGIEGTPTVFVNDAQVEATAAALTRAIDAALGG